MTSTLARLPSLMAATVALGALAALARFRPEFPDTPDSLSSPVTTAFVQGLAVVAAWLLAALVVLLLLVGRIRAIRAGWHANPDRPTLPARMRESPRFRGPASTHNLFRPLIDEPTLLVVAPPDAQPAPPEGESDGSSSRAAAGVVAEQPDVRPLISLLGPLMIHGGKRSPTGLRARALELIAFLALRREGAQRDEILEALWPGEDPKRSRQRLYQAVRDARRLLGEAVASKRDRYWLDRSWVRVDIDDFDSLLKAADGVRDGQRTQLLEEAVALVRGQPFAGLDYPWVGGEMRRLRAMMTHLFEQLGYLRLDQRDAAAALELAERGIELDRYNETLERLAMTAESVLQLRQAVIERYERLRGRMDELGLEPGRETKKLYRALLAQDAGNIP